MPASRPASFRTVAAGTVSALGAEREELPRAARDYVEAIVEHTGVPVTFVGVGPDREQYVRFAA